MSFRLITHTPAIGAAPGETVVGRVEIHNDGTTDAVYTVVVVGLAAGAVSDSIISPPLRVPVPAGSSVVSDVMVVVPRNLGIGQHAAAFEATSSRSTDRAALTPFTVSIQSVSRVELIPHPSTIRARRRADFHLDVSNREPLPVQIELIGEAPDVDVSFTPSTLSLQPGQRAVTRGRIRGPRHVSGEPTQHNILITARGRASTTSITAAYVQRPLFAHRLRMVVASVTVVALWLAAIGGAALWLSNRDDTDAAAEIIGVDTNNDGIPDSFRDAQGRPIVATDTNNDGIPDSFVDADGNPITGTDTNGDGIPDTLVDANGKPLKAIDTNGDGKPDTLSNGAPLPDRDQQTATPEPQPTILRGTVQIAGNPADVAIALTPIELGASPNPAAAPIGVRDAQPREPEGKIWSARTATLNDLLGAATRRTVAIAPDSTVPGPDGVWLFTDVLQGQSYEASFSSPGYDTQSFVLTPRADGEPIDLDVEMKPAQGALSGTVVGPAGPLGAAEIRITDGTLDFATTSASGTGSWSLPGVSTPGVYTVTATLRGFATAVRQIELEPGDRPTGITLQMVPGLGTITGIVTADGAGLGGVTVTASNGETTLTTTTLTDGNIGFYSLPQLPVPATYTVQATLDGYVTESRRVPLSGSLGDVNLSMATTTTTLRGRVLSSAGGGIESAGLIISTGDLQFRASTSPTGVFTIDRLPPGDYTVTAEHYQHTSVTEFATLVAGTTPAPLEITLPRSSGPTAVGNGSLVVSVINDDPTIDPPGINNARVTISRNRTAESLTLQDPNASAVTFDNLPIGTYTINVRADGYNVSAPVTKSVGQTRERAEIQLQKLGQASGSMVNSLDPTRTPLPGYSLQLYKLSNIADPVGIAFGPPLFDTNGSWTTTESALQTGLYRIEATSPTGFFVRNDQVLDTSPAVGGRAMVFLVPAITDAEVIPLNIPPIEADPYPTITGKIYKPRLNGVTVEYDAVDQPLLAVTGICNGQPVPAADITITDEFGPTGGTPDQFDTFTINKEAVARAIPIDELPGQCEFTVTAPGRVDGTINLTNIVPSDGLSPSDRLAAAALVRVPAPLTGTVFWFDTGKDPDTREPLAGVAIAAATPVITGFASTERSTTVPDPRPVPVLGASTATSAATTGAWTLTGQVFGVSAYNFTATNFMPASVPVTINETSRVVPSTGTNANVLTETVDGTGFGIELTPPNPGTVNGRVTIQTTATPKYGTNMVRATPPIGAPVSATPTAAAGPAPANPGGTFSFSNAVAGTWSIEFDPIPNHVREPVGTTPTPVAQQLPPGGSISGFDATFTELATVRVRLFDKTSGAPITLPAGLDLTLPATPTPPTLTGAITDRPVSAPDGSDVYELAGIPVATSNPTSTTVGYTLEVLLADYDLASARIGPGIFDPIIDARNISLPLVAGRTTSIDLYVESFKSITGSLLGRLTGGGTEALSLSVADPPPANTATMRVERVDVNGNLLVPQPTPAPRLVPGTNGTFTIIGAPGYYRLTPTHPEYETVPAVTPSNGGVSLVANVYQLGSTANLSIGAFELTLRTSTLSVDAVTQLTGGADVDGAVVDRYLGAAPCTAFPATPDRTSIPTTGAALIDLAPGTYCLKISKFDSLDPTRSIAFPAIVSVTVPRSSASAVSVTNVVAPLPPLNPTVTGTLVARNTNTPAGPIDLITSPTPGPKITSTFTSNVSVAVNGTTIPNLNPNSSGNAETFATELPVCDPADPLQCTATWTFQFASVPAGTNIFTAPVIPGYTLVTSAQTVDVPAIGPTTVPEFVYTADVASVEIALGPGTFPSLDPAFAATDSRAAVRLVSKTGAGTGQDRSYTFVAATNTLVISAVAPEAGNWTLSFDDALHAPFSDNKVKIAQQLTTDGRRVGTLNTGPVGDLVRLTGLATEQPTANSTSITALSGDAAMTLVGPQTYVLRPSPNGTTGPNSTGAKLVGTTYIFDVAAGTYTLTTTKTDFFQQQLVALPLTPAGTMLAGQNVAIKKQAVVTARALNRGLTLPADLRIDLLNTANNSTYGPTAVPATPTTNPTVSFNVPDGTYRARTFSATYPQQTSSPDASIGIGATPPPLDITLPRITRFNVSGPPSATVTIPTLTPKSENLGTTIEFSETSTTTSLQATITATDFRTKQVAVPAHLFTTTAVTLLANVTVSGSMTGASNGVITAVNAADSTNTKAGTITSGTYSIPGLDVNTDGSDKTWNISYTQLGVGTGSTSVVVSGTSATAETGKNITLTPRDVNYNFTVTTGGSTAVDGATVTVAAATSAPPATAGGGKTTAIVKENVTAFPWSVRKATYLTRYGVSPSVAFPDVAVPVSLQQLVGTVTDGAAVNNAAVVVCATVSGATSPCVPTEADRSFTTGSGGTFILDSNLLPGTYTVWATKGLKQGSQPLTIAADGTGTLPTITIA